MSIQAAPDGARQNQLRHLLKHDCGSCHGMTMKGGLGPALRPNDLTSKSDELLVTVILHGRQGTPMPPWKHLLSKEDAEWLVKLMRIGEVH
ncbi:MAG: cytochrome c [Sulfuriflexus sp.]|nr:cytochrome c [Sulfuriflexus sp.]